MIGYLERPVGARAPRTGSGPLACALSVRCRGPERERAARSRIVETVKSVKLKRFYVHATHAHASQRLKRKF